jgi:hypothetical protein
MERNLEQIIINSESTVDIDSTNVQQYQRGHPIDACMSD